MERFSFRHITLTDIANTIGKKSSDMSLTEHEDGTIEIHTPNLTPAKRTALRSLFIDRGYLEDPAVGI